MYIHSAWEHSKVRRVRLQPDRQHAVAGFSTSARRVAERPDPKQHCYAARVTRAAVVDPPQLQRRREPDHRKYNANAFRTRGVSRSRR
jgi:hypothetical protein